MYVDKHNYMYIYIYTYIKRETERQREPADTTNQADTTEQFHKRGLNKKGAEGPFHTILNQLTRPGKLTRRSNLTKWD